MWYVIVRAAAGVTFGTQHVGCGTSCLVDGHSPYVRALVDNGLLQLMQNDGNDRMVEAAPVEPLGGPCGLLQMGID